jgi:single-stranded-DNA-specific exonuclease
MTRCQWEITGKGKPASVEGILEMLLQNRGVDSSFLSGSLKDLEAHLTMSGMDEGATLMARHLAAGNKIVLIGDYDCDGVTSAAQMVHFLRDIGYSRYEVVIPRRTEGYGMPERAVHQHPEASLFVTMDCGTHDLHSVSAARNLGADVIVIDHHEVSEHGLAPATVLVNPKQPSCPSVFKDFCASGLTLLFLARLRRALDGKFPRPRLGGKYLSLAAIGTVTDLVPLVDANRILTQNGLAWINARTCLPINKLVESAGLSGKVLTAGHIGYYLGPRINAAGRMAEPRLALDLLTAEQEQRAGELAHVLNRLNAGRQHQEELILSRIRDRYPEEPPGKRTLLMGDPQWPPGVIGIIASRIQQEFHYGPVIVFAIDDETGMARGSARSIPGFDIHAALNSCQDLLLKWGGHKMAAGMTIDRKNLEGFSHRFEEVAGAYPAEIFIPRRKVDMEIDLDLVSPQLFSTIQKLEPHGLGNPLPTFAARDIQVTVQRVFGREKKHLQLVLDNRIQGIFWRGEQYLPTDRQSTDPMDLVFQVEWDDFRGRPVLSLKEMGKVNTLWSSKKGA